MTHIQRILFTGLFSILFAGYASGQALEDYTKYKLLYPKEELVCTVYENEINLKLKDNQATVQYKTNEEFFFLGDNNGSMSNRSIHFSSFYKLIDYAAYSTYVVGNKYKKIPVTDFQVNDFDNKNIFFDDSKELKFMFPQINRGNKTFISNTYEITDAHFLPKFSLSPYINYVNVKFTLNVPDGIEIAIDTMFFGNRKFEHQLTKKNGITTHTWFGQSEKSLDYEEDAPERNHVAPQIHVRITSYISNNGSTRVLGDLTDLYHWNCSFLQQSKENVNQFKTLSDSIVGNEKDTFNKAALIYAWVQNNIHYIASEAGYEGHIPALATQVCKERYGDCKGISNILYSLLKSQNLDAHMVWIGTRDLPYRYTQLPIPSVDNHMITALRYKGKFIFIDGTASNVKFGMPSPFTQGKEAMIELGDCEHFVIDTVEEVKSSDNLMYDSCYFRLQDKSIVGSGIAKLYGYRKMSFIDRLDEKNDRSLLNLSRSYLLKGSNRFIIDTVWLENQEDKNLPLIIHYQFSLPEYATKIEKDIYLNMNLDRTFIPGKIDTKRNVAIEYRYKDAGVNIACFELPKGYQAAYLPKSLKSENNYMQITCDYKQDKNLLIRKQTINRDFLLIYPAMFISYNSMIDTMQKYYAEQITLNSK